jgi:CTP synthase (UTP-ammonia lyase)
LKIADADTLENNSGSMHYVITPLSCALPNRRPGGPKASGEERLKILPGSLLHKICGSEDDSEQYYCNYGVNEEYERQFVAAGLRVSARGMQGETRAIELPGHPLLRRHAVSAAAVIASGESAPVHSGLPASRDDLPQGAGARESGEEPK